ncbi:TraL conjugative transposon family protein [Bacteroides fragilis]|nr:TraL conjugative transposon family protein [Bacteroides fragilis]
MVRKFIMKAQEWADERLRRLAGRITPDMRVVIVLVMMLVFGGLSVYMTVSAIYRIGRSDGREMGIEHIRRLQLPNDSIINPFNKQ